MGLLIGTVVAIWRFKFLVLVPVVPVAMAPCSAYFAPPVLFLGLPWLVGLLVGLLYAVGLLCPLQWSLTAAPALRLQ